MKLQTERHDVWQTVIPNLLICSTDINITVNYATARFWEYRQYTKTTPVQVRSLDFFHSIFNLLNMVIMLAKWSTVIHTVYHGKVLFIWFFFGQLSISIWWRLHAVSSFLSSFDSSLSTVHLPPFCTSAVATKYSTLDSLSWWIIHRKSLFCILQLSFPVCRNSRCSH